MGDKADSFEKARSIMQYGKISFTEITLILFLDLLIERYIYLFIYH